VIVATYSIAACDLESRQWGVAVQSKFLAAASVVSWADPAAGAVATQAYANPRYGRDGLALLREGASAVDVVARLTDADEDRAHRQLGVVDRRGGSASFTGEECAEWAGGRTGHGYAAQGNILVSAETVDALGETFEATRRRPLAERLSDVVVDLRVDDHPAPVRELTRLYGIHQELFGKTPDEEWLPLDAALESEVVERLARLGYDGGFERALFSWAGRANLEERIGPTDRVDPVVLEALRRETG
jgi:uncharacterized Ntn-hydrolase superfamily protein